MPVLRALAFNACFYLYTTIIGILGLPTLVSRRATLKLVRLWTGGSLWLLRVVGGVAYEFRGLENIPQGPIILGAKHQSVLETLAMTLVLKDFAYILKRELLFIPVVGWYMMRADMVAIDRSKGSKAMALMNSAAADAIAEGRQLIIFPEGTRRPPGAPPAYKLGLVHLYMRLGVPCVPVAVNTGLFWPRRSLVRRPGTAVIEFLPPIPAGMERTAFLALIQERVETASNVLLDKGRAELAARGIVLPEHDTVSRAG